MDFHGIFQASTVTWLDSTCGKSKQLLLKRVALHQHFIKIAFQLSKITGQTRAFSPCRTILVPRAIYTSWSLVAEVL